MASFRELIKKVQQYSGFSDTESKDALECMVETLAIHLDERERKDFASQLPEELEAMALSVYPSVENAKKDILELFIENQRIDESRAEKQIRAAWQALKQAISHGEINDIRDQLSNRTVKLLH